MTAEIWLDEASNPVHTINYNYDAASQLTSASDVFSAYGYSYDEAGRLISVDNAGTPGVPNVVFDYSYDAAYNMTGVTDSIDGVDSGVETYSYDALNRVTSITQSGNGVVDKRVDYEYDKASQRIATNRYNDLNSTNLIATTEYTYDDNGRLTDLTHLNNSETIATFDYTYDADNRITEIASNEGLSIFNYDDTDQLTEASHDHQEDEAYTYDDNGNRVGDDIDTGDDNQLLTDGVYNYEYDGEGNRTSQTEIATGEITEYEWDYRNRLTRVVTKDSDGNVTKAIAYTYDVNDQRIAKSVDLDGDGAGEAEVERYVLEGGEIALVFDGDGNQTERFFHGVEVDEVLAQEDANGEVLWALTDHQGTVRVLMDNTGAVVNQISYDSFGNAIAQTDSGESFRFTYTGREFDSETGNYYYRARYYDSETGLFISTDPIGFAGGSNNLYSYVNNSPLLYNDPYGESLYGVLNTVDRGAAGFADIITKPLSPIGLDSTSIRAKLYGDVATRNHTGTAFHVGQGIGYGTLLVASFYTPSGLTNLSLAQKGLVGLEVGQTGYGAYESTKRILAGCADWTDALSFLPLVGAVGKGAKNASKLDALDDVGDGTKNARNANLFSQGIDDSAKRINEVAGELNDAGDGIIDSIGNSGLIESSGRSPQKYTPDLSHVTGKAANSRQRAIDAVLEEDFSDLKLTHKPEYSPFLRTGVAQQNKGTQIGKNMFSSRNDLRNTIVHEELHHRWWKRGLVDHHPAGSAKEERFYKTVDRYMRMRGWK